MKLKFLIAILSLLLISCNNFNTYRENNDFIFVNNIQTLDPTSVGIPAKKCDIYKLPDLPPIPPIPLNEINAHISDIARVDAINVRHIKELRNYIYATQRKINDSYQTYLSGCTK